MDYIRCASRLPQGASMTVELLRETLSLRPPDVVMRLARLGKRASDAVELPTGLAAPLAPRMDGTSRKPAFDIDERGVGMAIYAVEIRAASKPRRLRSRACARQADRSRDRGGMDATFVLYATGSPTRRRSRA